MPSKHRAYSDPDYQRNRKIALERDGHACRYCRRPANTVDHIVPLMHGGSHDLDNLAACCTQCNSRRGNRARTLDTQARQAIRAEALRDIGIPIGGDVFYDDTQTTPSQPRNIPNGADRPGLAATGHDRPRLETPWSDVYGSRAAEVGGWARDHLGVELMPWQLHVAAGLTALDEAGRFQHRSGLVSVARQCGKSTLIAALVGWMLTVEAPRRRQPITVLTTAHRLDLAVELFHRLADILEARFGAKPMRAYGRNEVRMADGSRWLIKAATGSVGHGLSCDFVVADEVWDIGAEALDQGLRPTMRARPNPLFLMFSTAGTEASTVMLRYREQGLRQIDQGKPGRLYFAEWSPPPDVDPMTPEAWAYANPALGHTLEVDTLQAEAESPDRAAFLRASVNLWVASDRGWVAPGLWPKLLHEGDVPPGGVVAVETALDSSRYFAVRAVPLPDGRTVATVEFHVDTLTEALAEIQRLGTDARNRFAISPTIDLHFPRQLEQRRTVVGYGELLKWTAAVKQMIEQGRLLHTGEEMLAEHVQRAVAVRSQNAVALSSQRSPGPIELARCMVWAAALASRPAASGKPMVVVSGM